MQLDGDVVLAADIPSSVGGYVGIGGAALTVLALARFYWIYTHKVETSLKRCEEKSERGEWQLGFLINVMRAHGMVIPQRFWSNTWRDEPREITPDDLREPK